MKAFDINWSELVITINQQDNKDFELYYNDELVALMTPKLVGGNLKWFSKHMVEIDAQLIGAVIASRLIEIH